MFENHLNLKVIATLLLGIIPSVVAGVYSYTDEETDKTVIYEASKPRSERNKNSIVVIIFLIMFLLIIFLCILCCICSIYKADTEYSCSPPPRPRYPTISETVEKTSSPQVN